MKLFKRISQMIITEKDDSYWDKKATVVEWQKQTGKQLPSTFTNADIYKVALEDGYDVTWKSLSEGLPDYFLELSDSDVKFAISIGISTALTAMFIDRIGSEKSEKNTEIKSLEKRISQMAEKGYDKNNPFDLRSGANHRKMGHDIFSFNHKTIPSDYMMRDKTGNIRKVSEIVGNYNQDKFSMSDIINATYGTATNSFFSGAWDKIAHTIHHLAKDIVTPNGVPLPFSELLNKFYVTNNISGYKVENKVLDKVQNEFVSMRASDFTSIGYIELAYNIFYMLKEKDWKSYDKATIKASKSQLKVLTYGSCIITQMFIYLFKKKDLNKLVDRITNEDDGGTLNWPMLYLMIKNVIQVTIYQSKTNNILLNDQQQLINEFLKEEKDYGTTFHI